jgi:hypothetical protein
MMNTDLWTYREGVWGTGTTGTTALTGYKIEARDGSIGRIDEATNETGRSCLVVDTGPWIFGRKVMIPAGTIERVDHDGRKVFVSLTKDQIKDSPEFDDALMNDDEYRARLGDYYIRTGWTRAA